VRALGTLLLAGVLALAAVPCGAQTVPDPRAIGEEFARGDKLTALEQVERALDTRPQDVTLLRIRARVLTALMRVDAAAAAWRQVLVHVPSDVEAQRMLSEVLLLAGRRGEVAALYEELLIRNPGREDVRRAVGFLEREMAATDDLKARYAGLGWSVAGAGVAWLALILAASAWVGRSRKGS
jgi:tetratricopeptide (TPR) repeat protein